MLKCSKCKTFKTVKTKNIKNSKNAQKKNIIRSKHKKDQTGQNAIKVRLTTVKQNINIWN